ncbi:hypothetical protein TNCV_4701911 [Trichonephila clavipes]|uniref:Uncharacterized protein n=1 Tax=Trichonephila clavipes TaxID=2585209 RepID=A0A8X7BKM0_TRICX|nr:hypothetical protein TNCV_4701911 [Trichonephila clavipes]
MAFMNKKWKVRGDCWNVLRPGRPTKLRDKDRRVLSKEIRKPSPNRSPHTPRAPTSIRDSCFDKCHFQGSTFAWLP